MASSFILTVAGKKIQADLLEQEAPRITRAFKKNLPVKSFGVNAKFAGDESIMMLPFYEEPENEVPSVAPGDIGYYPNRQTLCLFYGDITPFAKVSLFARVRPDDLKLAQEAGREILRAGAMTVELTSGKAGGRSSRTAARAANELRSVAKLEHELGKIWESEPRDVQALRKFTKPPMGNMPCVMYANFDLFWAIENLQVTRRLALEGRLSAPQTATMVAALLRRTQDRVSKWDFPDATKVLEGVASELESPPGPITKKKLLAVIDGSVLYLDRLQAWVDAMIPWSKMDGALRLLPAP